MTTENALAVIETALDAVMEAIAAFHDGTPKPWALAQLEGCRRALELMKRQLTTGMLPPRSERYTGMGRMIVDSWPWGTELGDVISRAEHAYQRA